MAQVAIPGRGGSKDIKDEVVSESVIYDRVLLTSNNTETLPVQSPIAKVQCVPVQSRR